MTYTVEWDELALSALRQLSTVDAERVLRKCDAIRIDPRRYVVHLAGSSLQKVRIGKFRALVDIDMNRRVVTVQVLDKRGRIYKR